MLYPAAFANSLAILTAALYLVFHLIRLIAPIGFRFIFNAQFMGADVASLLWREIPVGTFLISLIIAAATAWIFAYVWAWLYNRLAK
jgi:2TM family of unknown function (DUF5676)